MKQVSLCKGIVCMMVRQCVSVFSLEHSPLSQTLFCFGPCIPSVMHKAVQNPQVLVEHRFPSLGVTFPNHLLYVNLLHYPKGMYLVSCAIHPPIWKMQTPHTLTCRTPSCHLAVRGASVAEPQQSRSHLGLILGCTPQQMMWPTDAVPVHTS